MWIFTKDGFYSAVEDRSDAGRVVVRTRSKDDVVRLARILKVRAFKSADHSDYPYRLFCSKMEWASYVGESASSIDYHNFKSAMAHLFDDVRMDELHEVWAVMAGWYAKQPTDMGYHYWSGGGGVDFEAQEAQDLYAELRRLRSEAPKEHGLPHRR